MSTSSKTLTIDLIIPVYNEEDVIQIFHDSLLESIGNLPYSFRIIYVNDGSLDHTREILLKLESQDSRVKLLDLSRNFGHQAALTAGLDYSRSEVVICMDGDGQHPPSLIPQMIDLYQQGFDMVLTKRLDQENSAFKKMTGHFFYRLINTLGDTRILPGGADFRLMSRQTVDAFKQMPEYHRFLRGMIAWIGFKTVILPYSQPSRMAGSSKYSLGMMLKLASDAIFSFSLVPLQIGLATGLFFLLLAFLEMVYVLSLWIGGRRSDLAPGWSSLMFVILIVGGFLMINLSVLGTYVGYIYQEVKRRPIYLIRSPHSSEHSSQEDDEQSPKPMCDPVKAINENSSGAINTSHEE
jgi:polyisoprenyl-phosphate glycosyltransferase